MIKITIRNKMAFANRKSHFVFYYSFGDALLFC